MRHAKAPATEAEAKACRFCRGTGRVHYCLDPHCDASEVDPKDFSECLHPTPAETKRFLRLQRAAIRLQQEIQQAMEEQHRRMHQQMMVPQRVPQSPAELIELMIRGPS